MPDAIYLRMGFDSNGSFSRGTAKTSIEGIPQGCKIRKNGKIKTIALGALDRNIEKFIYVSTRNNKCFR